VESSDLISGLAVWLQGVPPTLRPWVWMEASGAAAKKAAVKSSNYFSNMALAGERSPFLKEIEQVYTAVMRALGGNEIVRSSSSSDLSAAAC
jgi:hypothetical protein